MHRRIARRWLVVLAVAVTTGGGALTVAMAAQSDDAISAARFTLSIDGFEIASFTDLQGISTELEPADYLETNGEQVSLKKLVGKVKPTTIVLKRGLNGSLALWAWHDAVVRGDLTQARRDVTLTMYDTEGRPVARYFMENAWPSKLDVGSLKAGSSEVLTETATFITDRLQRVAP